MTQAEQRILMVSQLRLIDAVRQTAEQDGPEALAEFEDFWIKPPVWSRIWRELGDMARRDRGPTDLLGEPEHE